MSDLKVIMPSGERADLRNLVGNGFSAAKDSDRRGFIVFPELDTRKEINSYNREAILRKSRWLYANSGMAKRIIRGISRMVGFVVPSPITPDKKWNRLAKMYWRNATASPSSFDVGKRYGVSSYQLNLSRLWLRDGDSLTVFADDNGSTKVKCYEGHQIKSPSEELLLSHPRLSRAPRWNDGVLVGKDNEGIGYRVRHPDDPEQGETFKASSCHLFTQYERPGQSRGIGCLHHAVNDMLDIREMRNDVTLGIKTSNLVGFYLTKKSVQGADLPGGRGIGRDLQKRRLTERTTDDAGNTIEGSDEDATNDEYESFEDAFAAGHIPKWDDYEPGVIHDARPNENHLALWEWLVREIALGLDFPPEVIWKLASDLNGNVMRAIAEDCQESIDVIRMEVLVPFMQKLWFMVIGGAIARGELPEPEVDPSISRFVGFWTVDWIPTKRRTLDRGKEGKLNLDEIRTMVRTRSQHYAELQKDWTDESDQWLEEVSYILNKAEEMKWPEHRIRHLENILLTPSAGISSFEGKSAHGQDDEEVEDEDDPVKDDE